MFTDNAIEVCIKKFVNFLRKGFIKIITNISCLKLEEKEAEGQKAHSRTFNLSDAKYEKWLQLQVEKRRAPPGGSSPQLALSVVAMETGGAAGNAECGTKSLI